MFDLTICHPLSPARIWDGMDNALSLLKKAWDEKARRFGRVLMPLSSLGVWHPDSHRTMGSIAVKIASRALSSVDYARSTMFRKSDALLVARNVLFLDLISRSGDIDRKRRLATQN